MELSEICDDEGICNVVKRFYEKNKNLLKRKFMPCWHSKLIKMTLAEGA